MIIARNKLWTIAVRLPAQALRSTSVVAQKWHSITAPVHNRHRIERNRPIDGIRWHQWPIANESFVAQVALTRHFATKYAEKIVDKDGKPDASVPNEKDVATAARASASTTESQPPPSQPPPAPSSEKTTTTSTEATATSSEPTTDDLLSNDDPEKKLGLFARFKLMSKQYWYVLLPVHLVTSCFWFGGFYYLSQSGVDLPALLESLSVSESIIAKLRDSSMGHLAIAYMCYKIMTPVRYTVTLGGTTVSIKYLSQWGYIRPMPSKEKLRQMYEDQKAKFKQKD